MTKAVPETFHPRAPAERNPTAVAAVGAETAEAAVVPQVPEAARGPRNEGRISLRQAVRRRIVYIESRISSTPFLTKGAADRPRRTPEKDRSTAASMNKRAKMNSASMKARAMRSHRTRAVRPSHSDARNPK